MACVFDDQEFITFLKNELDNGYELQSNSSVEIIEYDEKKCHPILIELTGEDDVNLFDFENGMLWSNEPGTPEYRRLCNSYYYLYDKKYIDSLKEHRVDNEDLDRNIDSTQYAYDFEEYEYQETKNLFEGENKITTPEKFSKLLEITQKHMGEVNLEDVIIQSEYIEGIDKKKRRIEKLFVDKAKEEEIKEHYAEINKEEEIKEHYAEINPEIEYISFGRSADRYNYKNIKKIKNDPCVKPTGGLWACTYSPVPFKHSAWEEYCREESFLDSDGYLDKGFKFTLNKDAKLFRIDSKEDFEYLQENYSTTIGYSHTIDFEKLSQIVDGIVITEKGQYLLDFYQYVNPNFEFTIKPFCVPGIVVFTKEIVENVRDFNSILENQTQKITSDGIISAVDIGNELNEMAREGLVYECEKGLIELAEAKESQKEAEEICKKYENDKAIQSQLVNILLNKENKESQKEEESPKEAEEINTEPEER